MIINWSLQHKRDTSANWTVNDPILLAGQLGIVTDAISDAVKIKIGTGAIWSITPFFNPASSSQTLSQTLGFGNSTNGKNIIVTSGDSILLSTKGTINYDGVNSRVLLKNETSGDYLTFGDSFGALLSAPGGAIYSDGIGNETGLNWNQSGNTIQLFNLNGYLSLQTGLTDINHDTQINFNAPSYTFAQLTDSTVPYLDASKNLKSSSVTPTQLGYLDATSSIQTQLNAKESTITVSTNLKYWRGDKTFQTLDTLAVIENTNLYFTNARGIGSTLTGYASGAGTVSSTDSILQAIQKLNGNIGAIVSGVSSVNSLTGSVALTGTSNRITISAANVFNISPSYVGQSSITTLGTITTGVWNGTAIANANLANSSTTINGTSISLGASGTITANVTNALTVDNSSLQLNSGTTFDGSAARTISVKAAGITNTMLAGSIAYSKLSLTGEILNADLAGSITFAKLVGTDITAVGALAAGSITTGFTSISTSFTDAKIKGTIANTQIGYGSAADTLTGSANLTFDGTTLTNSHSSASNNLTITQNNAAEVIGVSISNTNAGVAAASKITIGNGTATLSIKTLGASYTTSGNLKAGTAVIQSDSANGAVFSLTSSNSAAMWTWNTNNTERWRLDVNGKWSNTAGGPTAAMHFRGNISNAANNAGVKFATSTLLATPESGVFEFDGTKYYFTTSTAVRDTVILSTNLDGVNLAFGTTTGTKLGTATSQKLALWNATPVVQPTTAIAAGTLVSNAGTALTSTDTIDGYTLLQAIKALRTIGALA